MTRLMTQLSFVLTLVLTGCVTPDKWTPDSHGQIMLRCQAMCSRGNVKRYTPLTGECECYHQR